ncbi:MAG: nucleotide exchange factor GrpE [Gemmatimonadetes bacterium]|nr:nucleotide exchange factor GrpE [Gemmatimonadota bacterium]MYB98771.1 nucleotide exchange factor GrpE [Gemmatimonadota bacterium]MYI46201.1 nucleotide exchange factor GrpE [Gemmatimonadota bacterium]
MNSSEHVPGDQAAEAESGPGDDSGAIGREAGAAPEDVVGEAPDPETGARPDPEFGEAETEAAASPSTDGEEPAAPDEDPRELRTERDQARDRHLRLAADFDNYRKRTEDRLRQRWDRAQADLVSRMLEPLDDLLRVTALEPESASVEAIVEGVDLVERKFFRVLEEAGVEVVDPGGEQFDPNTMEAMMRVPAGREEDDDLVERVFQRGYTFKGLLVRPARVSVYKA